MLQYIVGDADQRILLAEHLAGLADEGQTVDVWVDHDAEVAVVVAYAVRNLGEVLRYGFGVMGKVSGGVAVEFDDIGDAEGAQEARDGQSSCGVYGVDGHAEAGFADGLDIHELQSKDTLDMAVNFVVADGDLAKVVDLGEGDLVAFG